ncbi:MAG TPA: glycosyltransferase family 1 protein [Chromatiales bacterium]|nr:glycosyltransferase family 1 protein [Chromatiales bacterium]
MKILVSAYACEPNKGSEPSVGWEWAVELSKLGHEVWVITRANNKVNIDKELLSRKNLESLHFVYYDLPEKICSWKKRSGLVRLYYLLWQWWAYRHIIAKHEEIGFDFVHHVTFVSVRQPSFMGNLGIPFIFGPVGGGEKAPLNLRQGYGVRGVILDAIRDLLNKLVKVDPLMWMTFRQANGIFVTSPQTKSLIPRRYWQKTKILLGIGLDSSFSETLPALIKQEPNVGGARILYVGRLIYWKGMHLGLSAFASTIKSIPHARLTIVGSGPDEKRWRRLAKNLGVDNNITWVPWVRQSELKEVYAKHDFFLYPSLHDSGGMVLLESMAYGLPVVCLNVGGPGVIVDESCGLAVNIENEQKRVIEDLSNAIKVLSNDRVLYARLSKGAIARSKAYIWKNMSAERAKVLFAK